MDTNRHASWSKLGQSVNRFHIDNNFQLFGIWQRIKKCKTSLLSIVKAKWTPNYNCKIGPLIFNFVLQFIFKVSLFLFFGPTSNLCEKITFWDLTMGESKKKSSHPNPRPHICYAQPHSPRPLWFSCWWETHGKPTVYLAARRPPPQVNDLTACVTEYSGTSLFIDVLLLSWSYSLQWEKCFLCFIPV